MKRKKKLFILIFILIILIVTCRNLLILRSYTYILDVDSNKLKVKEIYNKDNYYIEIKSNNNTYPFRIYENLNNKRKIIKNIYFYKDESIECILPIINNKVYLDAMCIKDNIVYDYNKVIGENTKLDNYISNIKLYTINDFNNEESNVKNIGTTKLNMHNNFNNTVVLTTYKGLLINDKELNLFKKDIYNNKISAFINNYYIIADYENNYTFNYFYIVNLNNKEVTKLKSKNDISYDSYIQGIVDNKIYLYDKDNEIQYEIDIDNNKINIVSNNNYIKYYNNKKWEKLNKVKAKKEVYFNYETLDNNFTSYDYVKETNNYYYLFKKDGISYKLYRVDKNNDNIYKFILDVPVTNIYFNNNYLYYVYKNKLYYYSDNTGLKTILENSELEFNDTIKYYIY